MKLNTGATVHFPSTGFVLQVSRKSPAVNRKHLRRGGSKVWKASHLLLDQRKREQDFLQFANPMYTVARAHARARAHTHKQHAFKQLCFKRFQRLRRNYTIKVIEPCFTMSACVPASAYARESALSLAFSSRPAG